MDKKIVLLVLISSLFGAHSLECAAAASAGVAERDVVTSSVDTGWHIAGMALKWGLAAQGALTMASLCESLVVAHPAIAVASAVTATLTGAYGYRWISEKNKKRVRSLALATAATVGAASIVGPLWEPRKNFVRAAAVLAAYNLIDAAYQPVTNAVSDAIDGGTTYARKAKNAVCDACGAIGTECQRVINDVIDAKNSVFAAISAGFDRVKRAVGSVREKLRPVKKKTDH